MQDETLSPEALGLELALRAVKGNQSKLAEICGCTQGAIWQMKNKPQPALSVKFVLRVEAALGIPRHLLRPDFYPAPTPVQTLAAVGS